MVITLDKHKKPLGFCTERRARILIERGRACVYRYDPFVLIVKDRDVRDMENLPEFQIKIDPGAKHTGIAVVNPQTSEFVWAMQIEHRSGEIVKALQTRAGARRDRRSRETPYRRPKWGNHLKKKNSKAGFDSDRPEGWLPPSVKSAADNIITWAKRLRKYVNITACAFEDVRFDTQKLDNPDITGKEYQRGTLANAEMREYLLDEYQRECQYCHGISEELHLKDAHVKEWEHKIPRSRGGSDSTKNATLACRPCNQAKSSRTPEEWLAAEQTIAADKSRSAARRKLARARIKGIQEVISGTSKRGSSRYCAWVNASRAYVENGLTEIFGTIETASGGQTKMNREALGLPKDHQYDALCVGTVPAGGFTDRTRGHYLAAKATGRGSRLTHVRRSKCGIIIKPKKDPKTGRYPARTKNHFGFVTGDIVKVTNPPGSRYPGTFIGRVNTRKTGYFTVRTRDGRKIETKAANCTLLQKDTGFRYSYGKTNGV